MAGSQGRTIRTHVSKGLFTWREGAPANRDTRLGGLKHSPPLHASHLGEIVTSVERPLITTNKMADNRNVLALNYYFLSLVPLTAAFQCQGLLFCTLLMERSHQRQLTLKAALKYNAVLAPRLTSASRDEPFTWQKIARLEGCPGQVDRVPRQGGLPCLACKRFDEFSKETCEKLALPG